MTPEELQAMVGQTYGDRFVLSVFSKGNHARGPQVRTRCSCGYTGKTSARALLKGLATNCGCHNARNVLPPGESAFRALYKQYSERAEQRGYCWQLTKEMVRGLIVRPCYYCGEPPAQVWRNSRKSPNADKYSLTYSGLDRMDNSKGYTTANTVPCCGVCNQMKSSLPLAVFLTHVRAIAQRFYRWRGWQKI